MEIANDTLFDGELSCAQHVKGYRFSIDSVLLAHYVRLKKDELVLDLGAGCGVIGLILLYRSRKSIQKLTAFELQTGLAKLAEKNRWSNSYQEKMAVVQGDLRGIGSFFHAESFTSVVCNPPFYPAGSGRRSANQEALLARHQMECSLSEILQSAKFVLHNRGKFFCIYPAEQLAFLFMELQRNGFEVKRMKAVYSYPESSGGAQLILVEAVKNGGRGMLLENPLYIYNEKDGNYSKAVASMYRRNG